MQKLSKHILCLIFLLLPIMMRSQALPSLQLVVANLDIVGHEDAGPELVGIAAEFRDVFETVAGGFAGPEIRAGDIYGIGTAVNGRDADFQISCGRQKLQTVHITSERR